MGLCLRTTAWPDLAPALRFARGIDTASLELAAGHTDSPLPEPFRVEAVDAQHPDLSRETEEGGREALAHVIAAAGRAADLGAGVVVVSLGSTEVDPWEYAWRRGHDALRAVLDRTRRTGVRLAVELGHGDVLDSLKRARRLLAEVPDARLGLALNSGLLYYLRIDTREALATAGERLYHVRLSDATRSRRIVAPGAGEVSLSALLRELARHGYSGPTALDLGESVVEPDTGAARTWLEAASG